MIVVPVTFIAILGVVLGAYYAFVVRLDLSEEATIRKRLQPEPSSVAVPQKFRLLRKSERLSDVGQLNSVLGHMGRVTAPLQRDLMQAGLTKLTVGTLLLSAACLGLAGYVVVRMLTYNTMLGIGAGLALTFVPFMYVRVMKSRRLRKFEEQFPEAIDLVGRALRAGHAFTTGLAMAAEEIPAPVGEEFKLLYDRQNFGMPLPEALRALADRVPLLDARFFVTAVLTQRETGGNLREVLDNLATVIRDRFKVKRQVRVVTAHGRITGWILAALPPSLAGVLCLVSPEHMKLLVTDSLGQQMLAVALVLQVAGTLVIRKLVNVPY
jgi:tight adherence protein B